VNKVWVVAAGTGGHIFPGLSIAAKLKKLDPTIRVEFFGTQDRLEAKIIPDHGYPIRFLKAGRWKGRGFVGRLTGLFSLLLGFFQVLVILRKESKPRFLLSVGGYVSFPLALACALFRVPVFILEPNIRAGLANRMVSKWAKSAFCAAGSDALTEFSCRTQDLGTPVREDLKVLEIRPQVKNLLLLGGSQGAKLLNETVLKAYAALKLEEKGISLLLQAGEAHRAPADEFKTKLGLGESVKILSFIKDMSEVLSQSDLVIARAGAMTVAELARVGMPSIFVPFPFAADDHQRKNAELLDKDQAAWMIDQRDPEFYSKLETRLRRLCLSEDSYEIRKKTSANFLNWSRPEAALEISQTLLSMTADTPKEMSL
jgi:UDP-N-acetylglucosamine--N-acetylmuramyl-(pentapeptide) pyrophosphoryl-undecaprenol N-acetylglucosamine transferase